MRKKAINATKRKKAYVSEKQMHERRMDLCRKIRKKRTCMHVGKIGLKEKKNKLKNEKIKK